MSATKSVVSIVVGMLISEGRIASLDAPLSTWYPEWRTGRKAKVTPTKSRPGSGHSLLWWLRSEETTLSITAAKLAELKVAGFPAGEKLLDLQGRPFPARSAAFWMEIGARLPEAERGQLFQLFVSGTAPFVEKPGPPMGFAADGWLGQQLIVLPSRGLIAVRQMRAPTTELADDDYNRKYGYFGLVRRLEHVLRPATR